MCLCVLADGGGGGGGSWRSREAEVVVALPGLSLVRRGGRLLVWRRLRRCVVVELTGERDWGWLQPPVGVLTGDVNGGRLAACGRGGLGWVSWAGLLVQVGFAVATGQLHGKLMRGLGKACLERGQRGKRNGEIAGITPSLFSSILVCFWRVSVMEIDQMPPQSVTHYSQILDAKVGDISRGLSQSGVS